MKLAQSFYLTEDVVVLAKELLGKVLVTQMDGVKTSGIIVETEAYLGAEDKAAHVYKNRRTKRTEVFYREGGIAYVYMCYGIHYLFNIITNTKEVPHAILIRALEPNEGIEVMLERRKKKKLDTTLTKGPGALSMALGIDKSLNGVSLTGNTIWLEDRSCTILPETIKEVPRVGVDYAEEWATKPLRFYINGNSWVSKPNK